MRYIITESNLKTYIKNKFDIDLTGRVKILNIFESDIYKLINDFYDCLPYNFLDLRRRKMDNYGPIYFIELEDGIKIFYQMDYVKGLALIFNNGCDIYNESEFKELLGIKKLAITMEQFLNLYS